MHRSLLIAALMSTTALPLAAQVADDTDYLGEIIIGNTRTETPVDESTVSVSVVTEEEIAEHNTVNTTVGEILAWTVPGFSQDISSVSDYGLQLRGRNFQVLVDGVPQSNLSYFTGRSLNVINPVALEQVEVVRGATAAYGFGAPGGLVNLVTRRPAEGETETTISAGIRFQPDHLSDSFSWDGSATTSGRFSDTDYLLSFGYESAGSSFTADGVRRAPDVVGRQGALDDASNYNLLAKLGHEFETGRLEFMANYYDYQQASNFAGTRTGGSIPDNTSAVPQQGDPSAEQPGATNSIFSLKYTQHEVWGGEMELQAYYTHNDTLFAAVDFLGITYPEIRNESAKYGARLTFDTPIGAAMDLVWGLDYINEDMEVTDYGADTIPDYSVEGLAAFAQLNWEISDRARLTSGLRYEMLDVTVPTHVNELGGVVNGGTLDFNKPLFNISASYEFHEMATVFGGFSQGFELGALGRYMYNSGFSDVSQLSDRGQSTDSFELGIRGDNGVFDYSATAFYSTNDNGSTYDQQLNLVLAEEVIYGVELAANYLVNEQWAIGGTATFLEGRYDADGDGSLDTDLGSDRITPPKLTAYAAYVPNDWSSYRIDAMYSGYRNPDSDQYTGLETIQPYFLVDLTANYNVGPGVLRVGIENVLNEDYATVLSQSYSAQAYGYDDYYFVKGMGRSLSMSYTVSF